jgi:hypothetical protein
MRKCAKDGCSGFINYEDTAGAWKQTPCFHEPAPEVIEKQINMAIWNLVMTIVSVVVMLLLSATLVVTFIDAVNIK